MTIDYNLIDYIPSEDVPDLYTQGKLVGTRYEPQLLQSFLAKSKNPIFGVAAYDLIGTGDGKVSLPYKIVLEYEPEFGRYEAQTTGDCVSHGTRNVGMLDYCVDCKIENREYKGRLATENIYGARQHGGAGASCVTLAKYVNTIGGYLVREKYSSDASRYSVDLSVYNSRIGHLWGRSGTPTWLNKIAKEHRARTISLVTNTSEARDAIANGYGISVCSGFGFSSTRDANGVSEPRGSWAHCMSFVGCDDSEFAHQKYKGKLFLVQNSWGGNWNSGGKRHEQPDGSFWIRDSVAQRMLNQHGSFVISDFTGFKRRKLDYMLV